MEDELDLVILDLNCTADRELNKGKGRIMDWKDTVTQSQWPLTFEEYLKDKQKQAELSFEAGYQECDKKWLPIVNKIREEAKQEGRQEVVDFVQGNGYLMGSYWEAQLEIWFASQPELLAKWGIE